MARKSRAARDTGLRQVSVATKWLAGGAAVLAGFFAVWEARTRAPRLGEHPDRRAPTRELWRGQTPIRATDPGYRTPGTQTPATTPSSGGNLQAPDYAPAPSDRQPAASSGGS